MSLLVAVVNKFKKDNTAKRLTMLCLITQSGLKVNSENMCNLHITYERWPWVWLAEKKKPFYTWQHILQTNALPLQTYLGAVLNATT